MFEMIEEYIKLVESFKKNQISKLIEALYSKAFAVINSHHASPLIVEYFKKEVNCHGFPLTPIPLPPEAISQFKNLLLEINAQNSHQIKKLNVDATHISALQNLLLAINREEIALFKEFQLSPAVLQELTELINAINARNGITEPVNIHPGYLEKLKEWIRQVNTQKIPFSHFELEPDNISQIKKLINALYYARLTFRDLEQLDIRNLSHAYQDAAVLLRKTIETAYEATYLVTHLDVNLRSLFQEELDLILPRLIQIQQFAEQHQEQTTAAIKKFTPWPVIYKAGEITAIAADQMRPLGGNVDYNFLTQFSALLPGYIDKLTQYIEKYSTQIKEKEPKLNQQKLDEIQAAAVNLLNDLESIKGNNLFVSLKFLNYIHIIRNIITLSMSTLEQIGELSESSQDLIRDKLAQLKYVLLPRLFGLVDKIEVNAMLKPGTLSTPLMVKVQKFYQKLLYIPQKIINFQQKGAELLSIEDSQFIDLRLEWAHKRIDAANRALYITQKAKEALTAFFTELKKPEYKNFTLQQLPADIKARLGEHYKRIKPYVEHLDFDLSELIVSSLQAPESWGTYAARPLRWISRKTPPNHVSLLIAKEQLLQNLISKAENSQEFHVNLNKELIGFVHERANLVLFPYGNKPLVDVINEAIPLGIPPQELKLKLEKTEFLQLHKQYERFTRLIKKAMHKDALAFDLLTEENRNTLYQLYEQLRPYLRYLIKTSGSTGVPDERLEDIENYLHAVLTNKAIDAKNVPTFETFSVLLHLGAVYLTHIQKNWPNNLFNYYDLEHDKFLTESEAEVVHVAESKQLKVAKEGPHFLLKNKEQLTFEQAMGLSQWYANKHNKATVAQNAYEEFLVLLLSKVPDKLATLVLDSKERKQFRSLYQLIQPYCVSACANIPPLNEAFAQFDKFFVQIFSERSKGHYKANKATKMQEQLETQNVSLDYLTTVLDPLIKDFFARTNAEWHQKSQEYHDLAQNKFTQEYQERPLVLAPNKGKRAHHLLKDTRLSMGIHEFRYALLEINHVFNQAVQAELVPQKTGVPFPEMENPQLQLAQSKQLRVIKDIHNSLYHIEAIVQELEKLKDENLDSYLSQVQKTYAKGKYVYHLLLAYKHINEIIKLSQRIANDPHCGFIAKNLLSKAQDLFALLQEHTDAYQKSPEHIPIKGTVKYSPLFYVLNAFLILPKHIRALKNINYLTTEELNKLHQDAKKASLIIEQLINDSGSYFKLFLQTPNMLFLYQELKRKLNEFTTTAHDVVINNLDEIRPTLFTPMLREADHWEDKLGLIPGTLSDPLRKITDEFYKGLLHPLGLPSKKHIDLICDPAPLAERTTIIKKQITNTKRNIKKIDRHYKDIVALYRLMQYYKDIALGPIAAPAHEVQSCATQIKTLYRAVLPKLIKLKLAKKIQVEPSIYPEDHAFDELCNEPLKEYDPHLSEIEAWVCASFHYGQGLKETNQLRLKTLLEKEVYLTQLKQTQEKDNSQFVLDYTTEAFHKHLNVFCERHIGLQYTDTEYRSKLRNYLLTFEEPIISASLTAPDINATIQNSLKEKISIFEKKYYEDYYHLDAVRIALAQFKIYFKHSLENKKSLFENELTLDKKSALINHLEAIATNTLANTNLSIKERLEEIYTQVSNSSFERVILSHQKINTFSFAYLKMCFFYLLEALNLYTPTRKVLLNNIQKAVANPPKIDDLAKRFGLFAKPVAAQTTPKPAAMKKPKLVAEPEPVVPLVNSMP